MRPGCRKPGCEPIVAASQRPGSPCVLPVTFFSTVATAGSPSAAALPRGHEGSNLGTDAVLDFIEGRGCLSAGIPCSVAHSSKTIVRLEDTIGMSMLSHCPPVPSSANPSAEALFAAHLRRITCRTDRLFALLLAGQWAAAVLTALLSPRTMGRRSESSPRSCLGRADSRRGDRQLAESRWRG